MVLLIRRFNYYGICIALIHPFIDEKSKLKESGLDTKKDKERYEKLDREIKKLYQLVQE